MFLQQHAHQHAPNSLSTTCLCAEYKELFADMDDYLNHTLIPKLEKAGFNLKPEKVY
jgi:hypothetical protein